MLILIDQEPTNLEIPDGDFEAVTKSILKHCSDAGRVVLEIEVDGTPTPELEGEAIRSIDREAVRTVAVRTESMKTTARNILRSSAESLPKLIDEFATINESLQSRNAADALARIENALAFWIQIIEGCLQAIRTLEVDLDSVTIPAPGTIGGETLSGTQVLNRINDLLSETQTAFENRDNLEIGDIFEYDLPPLLRAFQEILYHLADSHSTD